MVKTDNHDPTAKLELRRHFLRKYHDDGTAQVLDCCQGDGLLWKRLRNEFPIASYWGLDLKPKKGRLKLDSARVVAQAGLPQDVIDIDTYGAPWKHWLAMLPNIQRPTTVFLTIGQVVMGGASLQKVVREALGLKELKVPNAIAAKLNDFGVSALLTSGYDHGLIILEAVEAVSNGHARYIGIRISPGERQ